MKKKFSDRIKYFKNVKRGLVLSIEALIGKTNTKKLMSAIYGNNQMSLKERQTFYNAMVEKGGTYVSKYKALNIYQIVPCEYSSNVEDLLSRIDDCNLNITKLRNGEWVELQEDYLPENIDIEEPLYM